MIATPEALNFVRHAPLEVLVYGIMEYDNLASPDHCIIGCIANKIELDNNIDGTIYQQRSKIVSEALDIPFAWVWEFFGDVVDFGARRELEDALAVRFDKEFCNA